MGVSRPSYASHVDLILWQVLYSTSLIFLCNLKVLRFARGLALVLEDLHLLHVHHVCFILIEFFTILSILSLTCRNHLGFHLFHIQEAISNHHAQLIVVGKASSDWGHWGSCRHTCSVIAIFICITRWLLSSHIEFLRVYYMSFSQNFILNKLLILKFEFALLLMI